MGSPTRPTSASSFSCSSSQPCLAGQAALGEARRLARRRGEALVALPARAAARDGRALAVGEQLPAAPREVLAARRPAPRPAVPGGTPIVERLAVGAVALRALAVAAAPGAVVGLAPEALQVAQRVVADEHDVAAAPAVAAVGAAARHVRFAAEAHAAVAAGAGLDVDSRAIVQHRRPS